MEQLWYHCVSCWGLGEWDIALEEREEKKDEERIGQKKGKEALCAFYIHNQAMNSQLINLNG